MNTQTYKKFMDQMEKILVNKNNEDKFNCDYRIHTRKWGLHKKNRYVAGNNNERPVCKNDNKFFDFCLEWASVNDFGKISKMIVEEPNIELSYNCLERSLSYCLKHEHVKILDQLLTNKEIDIVENSDLQFQLINQYYSCGDKEKNRQFGKCKKVLSYEKFNTEPNRERIFNRACYYNRPQIVKHLFNEKNYTPKSNKDFLQSCEKGYTAIIKNFVDNKKVPFVMGKDDPLQKCYNLGKDHWKLNFYLSRNEDKIKKSYFDVSPISNDK